MNLHLLHQTPCLSVYHDTCNNWLYLDWQGEVTLPAVQAACLELAACYLQRPYSHILNNNERVTSVSWNVASWLATDFLPHMTLAGIKHVAWVYSSSLPGLKLVYTVINWMPGSLITTFDTVAEAIMWLQQTRPAGQAYGSLPPVRLPATQAKLAQEVLALRQRVATQQRRQ